MKPHLLMLLLLAVPPLICNLLACENAEKSDPVPAEKSLVAPKEILTPVAPSATTPAASPAKPSSRHATPARIKAWSMM